MSPARLVFVDETGAATNMARRYGRSPRGLRLDGPIPHGHWKSTTFVGGLTASGFVAPYVLDGAMNGDIFKAWVEQMLAPGCGRATSSSWTTSPRTKSTASARRSRRAVPSYATCRPTPPTSTHRAQPPDPIPQGPRRRGGGEQAFAKLKALLRKAAERTVDGLWNAIGKLLDLFPASECANYVANSGYPRSA